MEEQKPASAVTEEEPPKKVGSVVATTNEVASLAPIVDENSTPIEEASKKVEMLAVVEEGKEVFKKIMVNEEEKKMTDVVWEEKGRCFTGLEVVDGEAEGDIGEHNGGEVEEAEEYSKGGSLGIAEAMNADVGEVPAMHDMKDVACVLESTPTLMVQLKLENDEVGEEDDSLSSTNVLKDEEGGELQGEQQEEVEQVGIVVEAKVVEMIEDDAEYVAAKVKSKTQGDKVKEVGSGGHDGGKLGEKEASDDTMITRGLECLEGSTEKDVDVQIREASSVIVNDGSIETFALASVDNMLKDIPRIEQYAKHQMTSNEVVGDVGAVKLSKFENIINAVEEIGVEKLTMVENIIDIVEEDIDINKHTEDMKNDVSEELEAQEIEIVVSVMEPVPMIAVESKSEDCELRNEDASLYSHDVSEGDERSRLQEGQQEEEIGAMEEAKVADNIVNDIEYTTNGEENMKPDGEEVGVIGSRGQDGGKLDEKKETKVSIFIVEAAEQEDKLDPFEKDNGELSYRKEASDDIVVVGGEETQEESIEKDVDIPINKVSTVDINGQSIKEVSLGSADYMFEDSLGIEQNDEGRTTTNEVVEVIGVEKPLEFKNIVDVVEDVGVKKHKEVQNIVTVVGGINIEKHTEVVKDDASGKLAMQDTEYVNFVVELTPMPTVESKSMKGEVWGADVSLNSPDAPEDEKIDELQEEEQEEEVGGAVEGKVTNKLANNAESAVVEENLEPECEKVEKVGSEGGDGGKLGEVKVVEVTIEEASKQLTEKDIYLPTSEASTMVMNDGSIEKVAVAIADNMLNDSYGIGQNVEYQVTANEVVEDNEDKKPSECRNTIDAVEGVGVEEHTVVDNVADVREDDIDVKKHTKIMDDVSRVQKVQDVEVIVSMVKPMPTSAAESKLEDGKLGEMDASLTSPNVPEGELRGEFQKKRQNEEVDATIKAEVVSKVADDVEIAVAEDEKPELEGEKVEDASKVADDVEIEVAEFEKLEPKGEKVEEVVFGDGDGEKLGERKEAKVSIICIEAAEIEDKLVSITEANVELSYQKESSNNIMVMEGEEALEELVQKVVDVPIRKTSIVVVNDGSTEEVVSSSANIMFEDSPWIQHNVEGQTTNEVVDDIGVKKPLKFKNFVDAIEDIDFKMHKEVESVVVSRKPVQDTDAIVSMVEPVPILTMDSNLENSELGEGEASLASPNAPEGDMRGGLWEEEEVGVMAHAKVVNNLADDVESTVVEEKKPEPEGEKVKEVGSRSKHGGQLGKKKMTEVSVINIEAIELEDKLAPFAEGNTELDYRKQASNDMVAMGGEKALKESTEKVVDVSTSEASTMVVNNEFIEEAAPASTNCVLEDSLGIEQYAGGHKTTNKVVEDASIEKPSKVQNVAVVIEDVDVKKYIEVEHVAAVIEATNVEKLMEIENVTATKADRILTQELAPESSKKNNDVKESECSYRVINCEDEFDDDDTIKAMTTDEDSVGNETYKHDHRANSNTDPTRIAILESIESMKQTIKKFEEGFSSGSLSGLRDFTNIMDGQNMLDDSKEDGDNDDVDKKGFDSAALAALLEGATSGTSYGNITVSSQDGSRILTMDEPASLGSSTLSLMPAAPCQHAQSNLFSSTKLAVTADPTKEMIEEEKNLHNKVELIRVNFLRLVYRLGAIFEETVTSQVLYRLSLVEGFIHMHGRQTNQDFSLDNARNKALILEAEGKEDLNFTCNILVLGKTGVGKSATINSIFGEDKSKTDAFSSATTSVQEYVGDVHGIKIRIIDTPGFQASVMDQGSNRKILATIKKYTKKCPPDIILYVDRLDSSSHDLNDLPLLKTITSVLGSSIWFNVVVALTHAASDPPEGLNGALVTYEVSVAQRSHIIHQSIRQATGDMRLMNPIALVENHPSCRRNQEGHKVLPNGQSWRHQMLLLCYSSKILSEANSLLKFQDPNPIELFGFHFSPLPFMLSSLLQTRAHPKLSAEQSGNKGDFHTELDDYSNVQQDGGEEKHDRLLPFKLASLTRKQKKQWKDEICKLKEMKKRGETDLDDYGYANIAGGNDQDPPLDNVSVPLPNIVLPPSFDCDNPTYRYRFLEPTSTILARPVLDAHGWDHDYGYDGVSMEEKLAILDKFPANVVVQVTKDKTEFSIHLDSSIAAKHGKNASSLAGFDIKTVGWQPAYILHGETKIKNMKKNETTGGFLVTFLGDTVATGLKVEDQLSLGKSLSLVASTGAMQAQGDTAYGAKLEASLKDKDYPIGLSRSTLGLSLMKWRQDLALGANLQSQFSIGRGSRMALRLGLNNKLSGQITVRTSTSDQIQIALLGLVPIATSIYRSFRPSEPSSV